MASSHALGLTNAQSVLGTRLQGCRLVIARVSWAILVVLTQVLFVLMLPAYFAQIQNVCTTSPLCTSAQPAVDSARALQAHSLTIASYAIFSLDFIVAVALVCCIVGVVIFWHRSDDWMALFVALVLMMIGDVYASYPLRQSHSAWHWSAFILNTIIFALVFLFFALFPNGRFVPRWARWIALVWVAWEIGLLFLSRFPFSGRLDNLVWLCLCGCSLVAQIFRYWSMSNSVQRQQIKWVVFGMCLSMITVIGLRIPAVIFSSLGPGSLYDLASGLGLTLAIIPFPLSIGFAMMYSKLWDIDKIINRTLVYGLLTALLVLAYFGSVTLLQYLFRAFTAQVSPLEVAGSTLAIALLFHPLRGYLQKTIDTCFNRCKYDPSQVLANFDATVRSCLYSCTDEGLESLTENMRKVIEETLQPSHISLYLYGLDFAEGNNRAEEVEHVSQADFLLEDQEEALQGLDLHFARKNISKKGRMLGSAKIRRTPVLINRMLVYAVLIGILALASVCILMVQQLLARVLSTQIAEFFIVGSILALVMFFKPLQQHIQSFIDRHFYRRKYRAKQRLDDFSATLNQEVNLTQLSEGLLEVVSETLGPEGVSLWINNPKPESVKPRYTGVLRI